MCKDEECHCHSISDLFCGSTLPTTATTTITTPSTSECERRCSIFCKPPRPTNCVCTGGRTQCIETTLPTTEATTSSKPTSTLNANPCERSCDVGSGYRTCGEILTSEDNDYDCKRLAQMGCNQCYGCDKCNRLVATSTSTPAKPTQILPDDTMDPAQYSASKGIENSENTWTKIPGMRCARDNRDHFWYAEWWYNSIISYKHDSMEACQKECEKNPYCNACDYWPGRPRPDTYGEFRSFYQCDLRAGAPCAGTQCSHVMMLDRKDKNWVVKGRQCSSKATCGYTDKMARGMHYDWFFLYQGGMVTLSPDSEDETYTCLRHSLQPEVVYGSNTGLAPGNYGVPTTTTTTTPAPTNAPSKIFGRGDMGPCLQWDSKEIDVWKLGAKYREQESGRCFCFYDKSIAPWVRVPVNSYFCVQWSCSQTETSVRRYGSTYTRNSYYRYSSYYSYYSGYTRDQEITNCACTLLSANGKFCQEWQCVENVDLASEMHHLTWDDFDELETERYVCTDTEIKGTLDGKYCMAWTGTIVGRHEFELTDCRVTSQYNGQFYPTTWSCLEDGYHFWQRSWVGVVMACIFMVFSIIFALGKGGEAEPAVLLIFLTIAFVIATLISVMCAGLVGFIAVVSVFAVLAIALGVCIIKK